MTARRPGACAGCAHSAARSRSASKGPGSWCRPRRPGHRPADRPGDRTSRSETSPGRRRGRRDQFGFIKLAEPVLALQGQIGQSDPGAARAPVDGVVAHRRDHSNRHSVYESVEHIGQRAETVRALGAAPSSLIVVASDHDHVVEVGLDQEMPVRQGRGRWRQHRTGPPGIVERLAGDQGGRRTFLSAGKGGNHREDGNGSVDGARGLLTRTRCAMNARPHYLSNTSLRPMVASTANDRRSRERPR